MKSIFLLAPLLAWTASAKVEMAGINIAGCDFGMNIDGSSNGAPVCPPTNHAEQMNHFVKDDFLNVFRLPVGWQYLVNNNVDGDLDSTAMGSYDQLVQACLATGASCIIDIHNYARWNGAIIGQGGPSNDQFAKLWSQLATKYASSSKIIFGIMNEPHELDMNVWAVTVQAVVSAIRAAGATSQQILLPGTTFTAVGGFAENSAPALSTIKDSDGSTTKLIYDVHQYLDNQGGKVTECFTDGTDSLNDLFNYLQANNRQAILSETGGGNTDSCAQYMCAQLAFLNSHSPSFVGWTGWAAGAFDANYELSEVPNGSTDTSLVTQCIAGEFNHDLKPSRRSRIIKR